MARRRLTGLYCQKCSGRVFIGNQYYAFQKNFIDLTCTRCSWSKDIEVKKLNWLLDKLGFNKTKEYHDIKETNSK